MKNWILGLVLLLLASQQGALSFSSYDTDKDHYAPGDSGIITLTLDLSHPLQTGESLVKLSSLNVEVGGGLAQSQVFFIGDTQQGTTMVSIPFKVPNNAGAGIYMTPVVASATAHVKSGSDIKYENAGARTSVPVRVVEDPVLSLKVLPDIIREKELIEFTVCNKGGNARSIELSLQDNLLLSEGSLFFGSISKDECKSLTSTIDGEAEGKSNLKASLKYKNDLGDVETKTLLIPVVIDKISSSISITHDNEIISNKQSKIKFTIFNKGKDANDLRIRFESGMSFIGKSEASIASIASGKSQTIEENVYTQLNPGIKEVNVVMIWREEGKEKTSTVKVPVKVISTEGVDMYLDADQLPITAGKENSLSVIVANKAAFDITGLSVQIESNAFDILDVETKKFIGSLQTDDFSSEQYKIKFKGETGEKEVKIKVEYKDPSGNLVTEEKIVSINVRPQEANFDLFPLVTILIIAGIGIAGYKMYRGKK